MKSKITIINIVLVTIAAIESVLSAYGIMPLSDSVIIGLRWLALASLVVYAILKKNLTTSILISILVVT